MVVSPPLWTAAWALARRSHVRLGGAAREAPVPDDTLAASRLRNLFPGRPWRRCVHRDRVPVWKPGAGTSVFLPYILKTLGAQSQAASVACGCWLRHHAGVVVLSSCLQRPQRPQPKNHVGRRAIRNVVAFAQLIIFPFNTDGHRYDRPLWLGVRSRENTPPPQKKPTTPPHPPPIPPPPPPPPHWVPFTMLRNWRRAHVQVARALPASEIIRARARNFEHQADRPVSELPS